MSHIALYRKYRPQTFADVRGQFEAVSYLESIVKSGRVPHAILLTGSRGTGKTTLARIFAKSLGIDAHDVYEIDAASYRKVENMRELLNDVLTLPISSPYKLYILDEVHMLTNESFNTFLKTLEEPPSHVIFVLATTDPQKVLPTIVSRCQVLQLQKPGTGTLSDQVIEIAEREGKDISREHATLIAQRAQGSFRDALVLLDQILEQTLGATISQEDIDRVGLRSTDHLAFQFIQGIAVKNSERLLEIINEVGKNEAKNLIEFLEKVLHIMRMTLYATHAKHLWEQAQQDLSDEQVAHIQEWSATGAITPEILATFLDVYEQIKRSTVPAIPIELAIIDSLGNTTQH